MSQLLIDLVKTKFPDAVVSSHSQHGDETVVIQPSHWAAVGQFLRDDPRCDMAM